MSFDAPKALWLLLLLMPAAAICFARLTPDGIIPSRLLFGAHKRRLNRRLLARLCILCAVGCVIVELARPHWRRGGETDREVGAAALLLDLSGSMEARGLKSGSEKPVEENLTGMRLDMAKEIALGLLEKLEGRNISLIAFARRAYMVSPLTKSVQSLKERVDALEILEYEDGTAIGEALICACQTLEQERSSRAKHLYLVSDGADHSDITLLEEAVAMLQKTGVAVYPIIVGGDYSYHSVREANGNLIWQANGEKANIEMIEKLANETGGRILQPDETVVEYEPMEQKGGGSCFCLCLAALLLAFAGLLGG